MSLAIAAVDDKRTAFRVMPGFRLSLGFALFYLALMALMPLSAVFLKTFKLKRVHAIGPQAQLERAGNAEIIETLISNDLGFTGRGHIDDAFFKAGLATDIALTAMDSDVIKRYVTLGLGVGIVASMAFDHGNDKGLRAIEASHLIAPNVTRLAVRRGAYLRSYTYDFIQQFMPELQRGDIERALNDSSESLHSG